MRLLFVTKAIDDAAQATAAGIVAILQQNGLPILDWHMVVRPQRQHPAAATSHWKALLPRRGMANFDLLVLDVAVDIDGPSALELRRVAGSDPMIAFSLPCFEGPPKSLWQTPAALIALRRSFFPPVTYGTLPDRRCLYVKGAVWAEFGPGESETEPDWDDAAFAVNRVGFRIALANHALVRCGSSEAEASGSVIGSRAARLEQAHPGARRILASFLSGAPREVERLFDAARPDQSGRYPIAFDLAHVTPRHSGTTELLRALIGCATRDWRDCALHVIATQAVYDFHLKALPDPPRRVDPDDPRRFAAFIRIGQPFNWKDIERAVRRAPALVFFMLDAIGLDCQQLAPDEFDAVLRFALTEADGLVFNSMFTARQFDRRFGLRPDMPRLSSLHSLSVDDYRSAVPAESASGADHPAALPAHKTVLIIGNELPHKRVEATARLLADARLGLDLVGLGLAPGRIPGVASFASGSLDPAALEALFERAHVIVYPTVYEGFGLPVLQALAWRKPVVLRRLPPFEEIVAALPDAANIHFFDSDSDLLRLVGEPLAWIDERRPVAARNWSDCTADLRLILDQAVAQANFDRTLRRIEFMRGRMAWSRTKRFRPNRDFEGPDEALRHDLDRLAGFAGRFAQDSVHWLGSRMTGRAALAILRRLRRRAAP